MSYYDDASLVLIPSGVKASKVYSQKPTDGTGDLTFSRASTATRTNASGVIEAVASNVPRLDYSGGATCPRLLLEPQRTNSFLRSEEFDNAIWGKFGSTITANATTSPDGTVDADTIIATSTSGVLAIQVATIVSNAAYAVSFYVKQNTQRFVYIRFTSNASANNYVSVVFDLQDGTVGETSLGSSSGTLISANASIAANGFYRISLVASINRTDGNIGIGFASAKTGNTFNIAGSITSSVTNTNSLFIWGAQIEAGSFVSSYIPTTTAAVTRLAENCNKTSISSLIGQTEGTMFLDFIFKTPSVGTHGQMGISSPTSPGDRLIIWNNITLNTLAVTLQLNNLSIFTTSLGTFVDGQRYKIALAYKSGSNAAYVNGAQAFTNSTTFTFNYTITDFILGAYAVTAMPAHQLTNQAALFPTRLTNAQLAELTTL